MSWELALALGGAGLSSAAQTAASIDAAQAGIEGARMERIQIENQMREAELSAVTDEQRRMEDLDLVLAANDAAAAAQGQTIGGPTNNAIFFRNLRRTNRDIASIRLLGKSRQFRFGIADSVQRTRIAGFNQSIRSAPTLAALSFAGRAGQTLLSGGFFKGGESAKAA